MKNARIRKAMIDTGITQTDLANIMGTPVTEISVMLKRELAKAEQDKIIAMIKESMMS